MPVNFLSPPEERIAALGLEKIEARINPKNHMFVGRIHYSMNPTYTPERVERERGTMSKIRWDRDMELKYYSMGGQLIFGCFDRDKHVVKPFTIPKGWFRYRVIDYGRRNPTCCLWIAIDYNGRHYVYREWYHPSFDQMRQNSADGVDRFTLSQHCRIIKSMSGEIGKKKAEKYLTTLIDPQAGEENFGNSDDKKTVLDRMADNGVVCEKASKATDGLNVAEGMIRAGKLLFFDGCCENTLLEKEDYRWADYTEVTQQGRNLQESPKKKNDHAMNCIKFVGNYPIKCSVRPRPLAPKAMIRQQVNEKKLAKDDVAKAIKKAKRYGVAR